MGFLTAASRVVAEAAARAMLPPPPPDITRWCEENIVFDERSPMPGPFRISRFPFLRQIHEVLSPEHPCREVTVMGSAQWGKTESVLLPTIAVWHITTALNSLVVQPTTATAREFARNKWNAFRRNVPAVREVFGAGAVNYDTLLDQETIDQRGSIKITSAGSPDDLAQTSRRLVAMDDVAKFEMNEKGDPEAMAESRAAAFEDAKILRLSTPQIAGTCRITKAWLRSDQRHFHVPCLQCGTYAPLTWENFRTSIDPDNLQAAHFTCQSCGAVIGHGDKEAMVAQGRWVAHNPRGDHPGFYLWRAYAPQRDWASIAVDYARVMGWSAMTSGEATETALRATVEAETEQTFWNDVLGLPYEQASKGPDWTALRDRAEGFEEALPRRIVPAKGVILTAGVDCQHDRIEVHVVAHGANLRRWVVEYIVIPHCITEEEGCAALDALLKTTFRTERGLPLPLDMLAIDMNAYTDAVWAWAKRHPWTRVILVRGSPSQTGPIMQPARYERKKDGAAKRAQKRAFNLNVSQMKADFYGWLEKTDPLSRGYCAFAKDLGDEYYRQVTSEVRVLKRSRSGTVTSQWELVEPGRRNEALDTMNYAGAAALRKGWAAMTDEDWHRLELERAAAPAAQGDEGQPDLFDAAVKVLADPAPDQKPAPAEVRPQPKQAGSYWGDRPKKKRWF